MLRATAVSPIRSTAPAPTAHDISIAAAKTSTGTARDGKKTFGSMGSSSRDKTNT